MQKNRLPEFLRLFLLCIFAVTAAAFSAAAMTVTIPVEYQQTHARTMLDMINQARATQGISSTVNIDYNLEKAAMKRAVEIAVYYAHTRPNGTDLNTLVSEFSLSGKPSENIYVCGDYFYGSDFSEDDAKEVFEVFMNSSSHRSTILNSGLRAVGIGYARVGGLSCWVQDFCFSTSSSGGSYVSPVDGNRSVSVEISDSLVSSNNWFYLRADFSKIIMKIGETKDLPQIYEIYGEKKIARPVSVNWTVADSSIASTQNGKIYAKNAGTSELTATAGSGKSLTIKVQVSTISLSGASVTLPAQEYTVTGKQICPLPVVVCNGVTLKNGTDYTLSYDANKEAGSGAVYIEGIGNYYGNLRKYFTIKAGASAANTQTGGSQSSGSGSNQSGSQSGSGNGQSGNQSGSGNGQTTASAQVYASPVITSVKNKTSSIKISWKKVSGAYAYRVSWLIPDSNTWVGFEETKKLSCELKKPVNGRHYYFRVECLNAKNYPVGEPSRTEFIVYLSRPSLKSVKHKSSKTALVRWYKEQGVSGYQIRYKVAGKKYRYVKIKKASTVKTKLKKLSKGKSCTVSIRSYKKAKGKVSWSAWSKAKKIS